MSHGLSHFLWKEIRGHVYNGVTWAPCYADCAAAAAADWKTPLRTDEKWGPPVVALGKFDALHRGHQSLAIAAVHLGGTPHLLSFQGMANVLGWEPRLPLVAASDRKRVLRSWERVCCGVIPQEFEVPFSEVRMMSPEAFVELLAVDLKVKGVVVGSNYRFGYKAAGTAATLKTVGSKYGVKVEIVNLLEKDASDRQGQARGVGEVVSSSRIREGLQVGDMELVRLCLGRYYRLICRLDTIDSGADYKRRLVPLNQPPGRGTYAVLAEGVEMEGAIPDVDAPCGHANLRIVDNDGPLELTLESSDGIITNKTKYLILEFQ